MSRTPLEKAALVLAALAFLFSVAASMSGQTWVFESTEGSGYLRQFNPASLIPVVGAGAALLFVRAGDSRSVWVVGIALLVVSALFLFSLILVFAPTALAVTLSAALLTIAKRSTKSTGDSPTSGQGRSYQSGSS